ncbi:MAG: VOC family protein [Anaerolineaceae bacterium]|nr:VOC family protein [Anaerolineaceae bacterium]
MSQFKYVNVVSVNVQDWERAKKFYQDILDWPIAWHDDQIGWMEFGKDEEAHIAINRWNGPEPVPPKDGGATPVLLVDDAYETTKNLRAAGVKCDEVISIPGVITYGTFYDPEGNRFQFVSSAPPPA